MSNVVSVLAASKTLNTCTKSSFMFYNFLRIEIKHVAIGNSSSANVVSNKDFDFIVIVIAMNSEDVVVAFLPKAKMMLRLLLLLLFC